MKEILTITITGTVGDECSIIMGVLLGDAHLQKRNGSYRLKIAHSIKEKEYVLWLHSKLDRLCQTTQPPKEIQSNRGYITVEFYTTSGKYLEKFHNLFYKKQGRKYVKVITQELIDKLPMDPLVLLTWFLDDGSVRDDCYAGKIATQGFTKPENELLLQYLNKWNINATIVTHTAESGQFYISLPAETFGDFVNIIAPVVRSQIPSMIYKLNDESRRTP